MTDPTLVKGGTPNFLSSVGATLTLYNTQTENIRKATDAFTINMPASDSNEAIAFDLFGNRREITVSGKCTRSDVPDIWKFAYDLIGLKQTTYDTLVNGSQGDTGSNQVGYVYTSRMLTDGDTPNSTDILRKIRVYVLDSNVTWIAGEPNTMEWSLTMVEISSTSSG